MRVDKSVIEFAWDKGNIGKNTNHKVEDKEAEEVFLDERKKTFKDKLHSGGEERFRIVGKTKKGRLLFVVFTIRKGRIRIISARNINKKEVYLYEETA
ncbi:MAG: BrnT family toxin [Candidatus Curtissbacteria bacterium]|nr:BrnT family toxin [Candidatus Curtissbacteria bacterium]